ncbi:6206_t:CDS:1 [Entrophospora sp. SA101]|nr:6206_t:CDS:1 [Entrophospora sp. SA101]
MPKFKPTEKDKEIINKANIRGKIKNVIYFFHDKKYVIVINKVTRLYAIRLINYEDDGGDGVEILAVKRFPDLIGFYLTKEEVENKVESIKANEDGEIYQCKYKFETHEDDMKNNVLIIGRTGSGKSALANVISNSDEFGESGGSVSQTKDFQIKDFELEGTKYRVIDTVGVGDTNLSDDKVMLKLAKAIYSMKRGIKQIFVVVGGKFTEEEIELFELAEKIFEKKIIKNTTIVRSKFDYFDDPEKCDKDKKDLKNEKKKIVDIINRCNGIIYVNNPPFKENEPGRQEDREKSRKILLDHLKTSCQEGCELEHWDVICVGINDYMNAKKWKENERTQNLLTDIFIIKREIYELKEMILGEIKTHSNLEREVNCLASVQSHMINANLKLKIKNFCVIT